MDVTLESLKERYSLLENEELLEIYHNSDLTEFARLALNSELQIRNIIVESATSNTDSGVTHQKCEVKRKRWHIENKEDALKVIRETSMLFLFAAVIQALVGIFIETAMVIDAIIIFTLGAILRVSQSRFVAILLLTLALLSFTLIIFNLLGFVEGIKGNVFLTILILWASIKAVQATFKLNNWNKQLTSS